MADKIFQFAENLIIINSITKSLPIKIFSLINKVPLTLKKKLQ